MIRNLTKHIYADSPNTFYLIEIGDLTNVYARYMAAELPNEIIQLLAKKYVEDYGDEILRRVQNQTLDAKIIQKVVSNLRKELKNETPKN